MTDMIHAEKIPNLGGLGNVVPEGYEYYKKHVVPGEDLSLPTLYLKWYDIFPPGNEISSEHAAESRAFIETQVDKLNLAGELGCVLLHRAGSVLLLMIITWRNTNELWESVYVKDLNQTDGYELTKFDTSHRGTYCVWELAAVWHERHAWVRFLSSKRDDEAKLAYINDRFSGLI